MPVVLLFILANGGPRLYSPHILRSIETSLRAVGLLLALLYLSLFSYFFGTVLGEAD
jgi:hypothetical protein